MNRRLYDLERDPDDLEIAVRTAQAFLPSTYTVLETSRLVRLTEVAKASGRAQAAKEFWPDIQRAFYSGRAQGIELCIRAQRWRWAFVAGVAVAGFLAGRGVS